MAPLVVEHTGGWHPYSLKYLKGIADHIAKNQLRKLAMF
jgi:hypothetical protein